MISKIESAQSRSMIPSLIQYSTECLPYNTWHIAAVTTLRVIRAGPSVTDEPGRLIDSAPDANSVSRAFVCVHSTTGTLAAVVGIAYTAS
eukprot:3691255-Rhodomonas_salina.1